MKLVPLISIAFLLFISAASPEAPADLVLLNGKVFTAEPSHPSAEAVAIRGEHIIGVGSVAEIKRLVGPNTRQIDLQGQTVVPGINDAHFHFMPDPKGMTLKFKILEPSWKETSAAIEQAVKESSPGTWIFGFVGHDIVLDERINRFELDRLAPAHPTLLRAYYGHGYILNSKAMSVLRIANDEPDPVGGFYERVAGTKKINGRLWEYAQWKANRFLVDKVSDDDAIVSLRQMADEAVRFGITSMQIFPSMPVDRFARLLVKAQLPIRVRAIPFPATYPNARDTSEIRQSRQLQATHSMVTVSGMKWILDGTPIERGAALRSDYKDRPGWQGKLNFPESQIAAMLQESLDFNQQLLVHAVGDKTIQTVFDAMDKYSPKVDWPVKRVRIEHADGMIDDLISRGRKLGVIVVQNPTHFSEPELFQRRWGTTMFPLHSLIEAGIPVGLGSDGPMNPFLNIMFSAIHPYNLQEAITREQAVRAYTYGSAFAEFAESEKGTISNGKLADLAVLSQDIFGVPVAELPKTTSVLTIVGGTIVYEAQTK
jgi:predicted amidohydrolase YtcJ